MKRPEEELKNNKEELRYLVFNNLMSLPAYKLNKQYQKIFKVYTYSTLSELIKHRKIQDNSQLSKDRDKNQKSIEKLYLKPSKFKILKTAICSFDTKYIKVGILALLSFTLAFLVRANSLNLIIVVLICFGIFAISFFVFFTELSNWITSTNNAFWFIDKQLKTIDEYISVFEEIDEANPDIKVDNILESIISDQISDVPYNLHKKKLAAVIFGFFASVLYVYIMGNTFIEEIKWIANSLNFSDFEIVKKFNLQTLTLTVIIPFSWYLGKYIYESGLKDRNKILRQSLKIVQSRIQKRQNNNRDI